LPVPGHPGLGSAYLSRILISDIIHGSLLCIVLNLAFVSCKFLSSFLRGCHLLEAFAKFRSYFFVVLKILNQ